MLLTISLLTTSTYLRPLDLINVFFSWSRLVAATKYLGFYNRSCTTDQVGPYLRDVNSAQTWVQWSLTDRGVADNGQQLVYVQTYYRNENARCDGFLVTKPGSSCSNAAAEGATVLSDRRTTWRLAPIADGSYRIIVQYRSSKCYRFLSASDACGIDRVGLAFSDVGPRQRWWIMPVEPKPTPEPTTAPTPEPTIEPTPEPTPEPTSEPTPEPTPEPTAAPTSPPAPSPLPPAPYPDTVPDVVCDGFAEVVDDFGNCVCDASRSFVANGNGGCKCDGDLVLEGDECISPCSGPGKIIDENDDCVCDTDNFFVADEYGGCECPERTKLDNDRCVALPGIVMSSWTVGTPLVYCYERDLATCVNTTATFDEDYGIAFEPESQRMFVADKEGIHVCDRTVSSCTLTRMTSNNYQAWGVAVQGSTVVVFYNDLNAILYVAAVCTVLGDNTMNCDFENKYDPGQNLFYAVAISSDASTAYFSFFNTLIRRCSVSGTQLTGCADATFAAGTTHTWENIFGMSYGNNRLYVTDKNTVGICDDNGSGELDCGFTTFNSRVFDVSVDGTNIYVLSGDASILSYRCTEIDKTLQDCEEIPFNTQNLGGWEPFLYFMADTMG